MELQERGIERENFGFPLETMSFTSLSLVIGSLSINVPQSTLSFPQLDKQKLKKQFWGNMNKIIFLNSKFRR